ncbi:hypothetical protein CHLNCDRAFT_136879 [Chlorella variabilis]|uniref:Protein kinase domain-containing protein n=1 Tax=Chlorella variabilis TaxID=554065 RepID=E1ZL85_CHLVA|nr:hypothetical protein CHLNCDRAFT_136879 [Chlorella variabilis]EFN53517.1 hypothetical protein CHLNCDRAFT_136879 [Chlorella variabilis]|eukprot:XP_005845619.1 hypothetical protein CHLNCDRAFT_136879 [Chlorella variabilis]
MKGGFKEQFLSAVSAAAHTAVSAGKAASKFVQQEALGAQCLLDYAVGGQVATAGSGHALWRIFTARSKKEGSPHPVVSAWILDKRELTQTEEQLYGGHGGGGGGGGGLTRPSQRRLDAFVEQCRHDVHALARLKHPGVLRLIAPLEETRTQLVFITEHVFASLADLLGGGGGGGGAPGALPPAVAQERQALRLSELEIKHGLLQLADALHFLHSDAGLLAGFGFSAPLDYKAPNQHKPYDYSDPDPSLLQLAGQPPLPYVAPELVAGGGAGITGAADVFSLGALAFQLLTRRQLLPVGHSLGEYESRLHSLTLVCAVDKSAPTVMCVLALGAALGRQHGPRLSAERVLPALVPLLVAPTLTSQQFGAAMKTVRELLGGIERSRAGAGSGAGAGPGSGVAHGGGGGGGGAGGRQAAPPPADWMAATEVGPLGSSSSPTGTAGTASTTRPAAPAPAAGVANGGNPLAGLQLQAPAARPAAPAGPGSGGGGGGFGVAGGRVGSGWPIGLAAGSSPLAPAAPAASAQPGWAFGGAGGGAAAAGGGGFGASPGASQGASSGAASLADPFAGLQLGGGGGGSGQRPAGQAAQAPGSSAGAAAAFDPFSLGGGVAGGGGAVQWPAPTPAQAQPQQRPGAGAGGWQGGSLI